MAAKLRTRAGEDGAGSMSVPSGVAYSNLAASMYKDVLAIRKKKLIL